MPTVQNKIILFFTSTFHLEKPPYKQIQPPWLNLQSSLILFEKSKNEGKEINII